MPNWWELAGIHGPNGEPFCLDQMLAMGVDCLTVLHFQADYTLFWRDAYPDGVIHIRYYLPNWRTQDATAWGRWCAEEYLKTRYQGERAFTLRDLGCRVTLGNEGNLPGEGGGWSEDQLRDVYGQLNTWHLTAGREFERLTGVRVDWAAVAQGHSDDQDDLGFVGLEICRPAIEAADWVHVHQYWLPGRVLEFVGPNSEWLQGPPESSNPHYPPMIYNGPWRFVLTHEMFPDKQLFISEAGQFDTRRQDAPEELVRWFKSLAHFPYIRGATPFIFRDPTGAHYGNDWGQNLGIEARIAADPKTEGGGPVSEAEFLRWAADVFARHTTPFNPDGGLVKRWLAEARAGNYLGAPEGPEHPTENGRYVIQEFASKVLCYDRQTGAITDRLPLA